jgi:hypothetical protein
MDRRAVFFILSAVVCFVLIAPTPEDLRWVPTWLGVTYIVLALLSFADYLSQHRASPSHHAKPDEVSRTDQ